jgi:hypothetical protein
MTDILYAPGFLGTATNFAADSTWIVMLLNTVLASIGVYFAAPRRHQV